MYDELNAHAVYKPEFATAIVPPNGTFPAYYTEQPSIIPGMSDKTLSVISPLIAYWALSIPFHALDVYGANWAWLSRYRIRESVEVTSKNLVGKREVVIAVIFQQIVQTILGVLFVEGEDSSLVDHTAKMSRMSPILVQSMLLYYGDPRLAQARLEVWGTTVLHFIYWWLIPTAQILFAL
jgi:sphinganine C4-monooxygenase